MESSLATKFAASGQKETPRFCLGWSLIVHGYQKVVQCSWRDFLAVTVVFADNRWQKVLLVIEGEKGRQAKNLSWLRVARVLTDGTQT